MFEFAINPGHVPSKVHIAPPDDFEGRDGRTFRNPGIAFLVEAFKENAMELPIDIEHSTEIKAPAGEPAPAVGWITDLEAGADGVYANVSWTQQGHELVAHKAYRYISPVFEMDRETRTIKKIVSAALTNRPNLFLKALNSKGETVEERCFSIVESGGGTENVIGAASDVSVHNKEVDDSDVSTAGINESNTAALEKKQVELDKGDELMGGYVAADLDEGEAQMQIAEVRVNEVKEGLDAGIAPDAANSIGDSADVVAEIGVSGANPDVDANSAKPTMVPRYEHDRWMQRALAAEAELEKVVQAQFERDVNHTIAEALREGKIDPASEKSYREMCSTEAGYIQVKNYLDNAKPLVNARGLSAAKRLNLSNAPHSLTQDQIELCSRMGISTDEFLELVKSDYQAKAGRA